MLLRMSFGSHVNENTLVRIKLGFILPWILSNTFAPEGCYERQILTCFIHTNVVLTNVIHTNVVLTKVIHTNVVLTDAFRKNDVAAVPYMLFALTV